MQIVLLIGRSLRYYGVSLFDCYLPIGILLPRKLFAFYFTSCLKFNEKNILWYFLVIKRYYYDEWKKSFEGKNVDLYAIFKHIEFDQ